MELIETLVKRNEQLFWFGLANLIASIVLLLLSFVKPIDYLGTNAWHKPIKFALSTTILVWSVAWYTGYLTIGRTINVCNWIIIVTLAFEVIYITLQASRGQASHYNQSSPFYAAMFSIMALAASMATLVIGYIGFRFFTDQFPELETYYLWAIRLGFVLFVIFSFEGFLMGGKLAHTVGAADGTKGLPFLNWSRLFGDLRVAHFIGMHALQVLPFLAWHVFKDLKLTITTAILYACLAAFVLIQALQAKPFLKFIN